MFLTKFALFILLMIASGCFDKQDSQNQIFDATVVIDGMRDADLSCDLLKTDALPELVQVLSKYKPAGVYKGDQFSFALYDIKEIDLSSLDDQNGSIVLVKNKNLILCGKGSNSGPYTKVFNQLKPSMTIGQLGIFLYPLGFCMLLSIFISFERLYSLRPGLTFPRKIVKALREGEFPSEKWKKKSSAERIVWVATKESPSADTLRSYARLEITSMERGLFLLEVVVSAAPLLGLLGTVTGLVKVFSQIPAGGGVGDTAVFSEGIAMALLTTIAGLAIAIPTLISHSYLVRLIEKRTSSISWLTERLVDAIYPKDENNYREIS